MSSTMEVCEGQMNWRRQDGMTLKEYYRLSRNYISRVIKPQLIKQKDMELAHLVSLPVCFYFNIELENANSIYNLQWQDRKLNRSNGPCCFVTPEQFLERIEDKIVDDSLKFKN